MWNVRRYEDRWKMVQIHVNRVIPDPKPPEQRDVLTFEFEDVWKLVLDDPFEWHMGAVGWQAKLLRNDYDVSAAHQILESVNIPRQSRGL
jgi:hypothetical protein